MMAGFVETIVPAGSLHLGDHVLAAWPPAGFDGSDVQALVLYMNALERLPRQIGQSAKLCVPDAISQLTSARILDASSNRLETCPEIIGSLAMWVCLNLDANRVMSIPASPCQMNV
jgi:Leucine-rich repeat (LRR) protein